MRHTVPVLLALLGLTAAAALVLRPHSQDPLDEDSLTSLLERPLDPLGPQPVSTTPFWKALLAAPLAEPTSTGVTLRLGRVLADPTVARAAATSAGELLALEAEGPQGKLGVPLARAILDKAVFHDGEQRVLKLYGCRHIAGPDDAPVLEDTYAARLALAGALREHGRATYGERGLTLLGEDMPVRGGVNFEVRLLQGTQSIEVTFDGRRGVVLRASRPFPASAPNDARARAALVAALRALAAREASLGTLTLLGAEAPYAGGVDLRLECSAERLTLRAHNAALRIEAHRQLGPEPEPGAARPAAPSTASPSTAAPSDMHAQ